MSVRCKMKCTSKTERGTMGNTQNEFHFEAVCADEVPENQRYHKYTPSGNINITVTNPDVSYEVGKCYYFDSSPVPA